MNSLLIILSIALAGPLIGSFLGVCKKYSEKQINLMLVFASGVMVSISIFELLPESFSMTSFNYVLLGLLTGGLLMFLLNKTLPHFHFLKFEQFDKRTVVKKVVLFLFLGISIHNFPEGAAIGIGALANFNFSLVIALAIALHDIPEAICISAPYYFATGKKLKAFFITTLTAIPTVLGFLFSYFFLGDLSSAWLGGFISFTAGIMIYISFFEIIPLVIRSNTSKLILMSAYFLGGVTMVIVLQRILEINS
jgi:zinc transporter, ZIP family